MPILHGLVVAHLSVTALLLAVFSLVVLCQRVARAFERAAEVPADSSRTVPAAAPAAATPTSAGAGGSSHGASVLDWTIDLRGPREVDAQLQTS